MANKPVAVETGVRSSRADTQAKARADTKEKSDVRADARADARADDAAVVTEPIRPEPGQPEPAFIPRQAEGVRLDLAENKLHVVWPNTGQILGEIDWSPVKAVTKGDRSHDEALKSAEEAEDE